ncbi:MAG TPA: tetratricopeptide repeat protein [Terriglobales bacterium]|nr:tetratricopeptide repeat protein [Terriglobales bacterium]
MKIWSVSRLRNPVGHRGIRFYCATAVAVLCVLCTPVWGQSQKDQVCQGGYGGGCGTAPSRRNEPRQPSARDLEVERHNQGVHIYNAASDAYRRGDYATALDLYQQALAILPRDRDCLAAIPRTRGMMAYKKGDYATALDYYQQALAFLPHDQYLLNSVASIHGMMAAQQGEAAWNRKDFAAALAFYQQAFAYYPDNTWRDNIAIAQKALDNKDATAKIQGIVDNFPKPDAQTAKAESASSDNLSFDDFGDSAPGGTKKGQFGTNVSDPKIVERPTGTVGTDTKAGDQLLSAAKTAEHGGDLTPNYDRGTATAAGSLVFPKSGVDLSTFSERAKKDPQLISMLKELDSLQARRSQLERERDELVKQRNAAAGGALMEQVTAQLNKKEKEYQDSVALISQKTQDMEKRHREIDTEVEAPKAK